MRIQLFYYKAGAEFSPERAELSAVECGNISIMRPGIRSCAAFLMGLENAAPRKSKPRKFYLRYINLRFENRYNIFS